MALPLYRSRFPENPPSAHPGLLFDKFVDGWSADWSIREGVKKDFYKRVVSRGQGHLAAGLKAAIGRRGRLVESIRGRSVKLATDWRLVSGLGAGHPFEAGFIWHCTLGVPYLPGSSVKGLVRAWAQDWSGEEGETIDRLFGPERDDGDDASAGSLIVFDGLPLSVPKLELDIMNPHYAPYYTGDAPPADYHSPTPIFFVTVAPGQVFEFALALRNREKDGVSDLEKGGSLLVEALTTVGAGGKTASGYGYFKAATR